MPDAKTMRQVKETIEEMKGNMESILEKESEIKTAKDAANDAKEKVEKLSERNAELVDQVKELNSTIDPLQDQVDNLDVKLQERKGGANGFKSLGDEVSDGLTDSVEQKNFTGSRPPAGTSFQTRVKGRSIKEVLNPPSNSGATVEPDYQEEIIPSPVLRTPTIMDLVSVMETSSDSVEWVRQNAETNSSSPQSGQGAALSETDMGFTLETDNVETLGHIAKASVQILNDAPRLRDYINTRIRALLELELEDQVLMGSGTNNDLDGLVPNASEYPDGSTPNLESVVVDGDATDIDKIGVSLLQIQRNNFAPTGIVLSPLNWWGIQLQKDADDNYQFTNPQNQTSPRLWGYPVIATNALPEGSSLVGNFELGATFFDRRNITIDASTENADDFEKLMVTLRAYVRGMLAVEQPNAMVYNDSMNTTSP